MQGVEVGVNGDPSTVLKGENVELAMTDDDPSYDRLGASAPAIGRWPLSKRTRWLLRNDKGVGNGPATREDRATRMAERNAVLWTRDRSVMKHREDREWDRLAKRIQTPLREMGQLARRMERAGYVAAAKHVRSNGRAVTVFAEWALLGEGMSAADNGIERLMGMIAGRCKRKRAHWGSGLRNLVLLLLVRKRRPGVFAMAERRHLPEPSVTSTGPVTKRSGSASRPGASSATRRSSPCSPHCGSALPVTGVPGQAAPPLLDPGRPPRGGPGPPRAHDPGRGGGARVGASFI